MPLFKASFQNSVAKLALTAYEKASGKHLFSADTLVGKARFNRYTFLGMNKKFTTIPEKK